MWQKSKMIPFQIWITSLHLKQCKGRAHTHFVVAPDTPVPMKLTQRCPKWKFSIVLFGALNVAIELCGEDYSEFLSHWQRMSIY